MKTNLKKSLTLGFVSAAVALGGVSVYAASDTKKSAELASGSLGGRVKVFGERLGEDITEQVGERVRTRIADYSWAVEEGIISQETADKISAHFNETFEEMAAEKEKMKEMTAEEREALFGQNKTTRVNKFDELVSAGIISQAEADALKEAMPAPEPPEFDAEFEHRKGGINITSLVESGVLDQATADEIEAYMEKKTEEMKAEMESRREEMKAQMDGLKNMTEEERKELFGSNPAQLDKEGFRGIIGIKEPVDILTEMVNESIISEAQADAIRETMPLRKVRTEIEDTDTSNFS